MRHVQIEKGDKEHTDKNRELIIEMINFIEKYYSGRITDCGGDITEECNEYNCKQFYTCKRNYELTDRIEGIKNKAGRGE